MHTRLQLDAVGLAVSPVLAAETGTEMESITLLEPFVVTATEEPPVGRSFSLGPAEIAPQRARTSSFAV